MCGLGALAYLGMPAATLLTDVVIVLGSMAVAAYLLFCGRRGVKAAQVIAPSAAAFALVALAAAVTSASGMGESLTGPAATGGFAAAGAILLALAVIASEEIAVLPFLHGSHAARLLEAQAADPQDEPDAITPFANLALAAIGSAHQGVFALDLRAQLLTLSPEATAMLGLGAHETTLSESDWLAHVHPEDRGLFRDALAHARPGQSIRLEFRTLISGYRRKRHPLAGAARQRQPAGRCRRSAGPAQRHHRPQGRRGAAAPPCRPPIRSPAWATGWR